MSDPVETWMHALARHLGHLPDATQDDILAEVRSHIRDRISQGIPYEQVLAGFGEPQTFVRSFDGGATFDAALARREGREALAALLEELWRSMTIGFGLVSSAACALVAARIVLLAWRTPGWLPDLGAWLIPAVLLSVIILALTAHVCARLAIKRLRAARSL